MRKGFQRRFDPIKVMTDSQVEAIHRATLDVLERTGIRFESVRALNLLKQKGLHGGLRHQDRPHSALSRGRVHPHDPEQLCGQSPGSEE